jgi:hypothetical protein
VGRRGDGVGHGAVVERRRCLGPLHEVVETAALRTRAAGDEIRPEHAAQVDERAAQGDGPRTVLLEQEAHRQTLVRRERRWHHRFLTVEGEDSPSHFEIALPSHPVRLDAGERVGTRHQQVAGRRVRNHEVERELVGCGELGHGRAQLRPDHLHHPGARVGRLRVHEVTHGPRRRRAVATHALDGEAVHTERGRVGFGQHRVDGARLACQVIAAAVAADRKTGGRRLDVGDERARHVAGGVRAGKDRRERGPSLRANPDLD